jgi:3,4-dihydroxy 2-butanone 4-phosphate synthase / GTP cyclohydrolase II
LARRVIPDRFLDWVISARYTDRMRHETVQRALDEIRAGRMVILVDDEDRENEGDLCLAAEKVTPDAINFMAKHARGLICVTLTEERIAQLELPMMVEENTSSFGTAFTVSIEARRGVSTGISAADRATTILAAIHPDTRPQDLVRPGHVFPLRARQGGVLVRTGQTEGAVDMARLAGLTPAGVICEIMNDDGSMARMADLEGFAKQHGLLVVTIAELIQYRLAHETLVRRLASREVRHPRWGQVTLHAYGTTIDARQHLVVVKGDLGNGEPPLVRVHSGYPLPSLFGDLFTDDRASLNAALQKLGAEQRGVLVCIDHGQPPSVSLAERLTNLGKIDQTSKSEGIFREIGIGSQILRDLGLSRIRVLSNSPKRFAGLEGYGLYIEEVVPLAIEGVQFTAEPRGKLEVVEGGR